MNTFKKVSDFELILDNCLARMQSDEPMEQCLADYPECAGQLRPLLEAAAAVQTAPPPAARPQAVEQGQAAMLAALNGRREVSVTESAVSFGALRRYAERILSVLKQEVPLKEGVSQMKLAFRSIVTTVLVLFVSGFLALAISANSLPGEPFYPLKRGWEAARLGLTVDPDARQLLEAQIQQNRQAELEALIELGRQTQIVYEGFVEQLGEEALVVDGFVFELNSGTRMLVEPEVGEPVRIKTEITAEGRLIALEISAGSADSLPPVLVTATATPCNTPTCAPPTPTPTPCNTGACGGSTPTPPPTSTGTPNGPTPTPCNTPACPPQTATPTPTVCNAGACVPASPTPVPTNTNTPGDPTPTPCNDPACTPPTATPTPCNTGACGNPSPTPPAATSTPNNPTPTPCNAGACGNPSPTPPPTSTSGPGDPTPTPCNDPTCAPPTPTPTPCNAGACTGPTPTPPPTNTPGDPTPTPCNSPACSTPVPTPTICNAGACTSQPISKSN